MIPARNAFVNTSNFAFPDAVKNPDSRIVEVLAGLAAHYFKSYCFPTQDKILDLLRRFTGRVMSRRTLNRHLAALERDGQIRRQQRHKHDPRLGLVLHSTLYHIGGRFLARLSRIGEALRRWKKARGERRKSPGGGPVPYLAQHRNPYLKGYRQRE